MSQPTEQQDPRTVPPKKFVDNPAKKPPGSGMADDQSDAQGTRDRDTAEPGSQKRPETSDRSKGQAAAPRTDK